jgi:hypothetical protein
MSDLHFGTGKDNWGRARLCYLQFNNARFSNSSMARPLC